MIDYPKRGERKVPLDREKQRLAQRRYFAKTKQYLIRVNPDNESDIIERLDSVPNRSGYIKGLVRADIARSRGRRKR